MRPLDFYQLGLQLSASAVTEAEYRNAIGRLYYGLHHEACCRYFRVHPSAAPLGKGSRHAQLIRRYRSLGSQDARQVQRHLGRLSSLRNISDYDLAGPIRYRGSTYSPSALMNTAVSVATALLAALETFSPGAAADGCVCRVTR